MSLEVTAQDLNNAYWNEGKTLVDLGKHYGESPGTVWGWFRKLGIPTRGIKESSAVRDCSVRPEETAEMVRLYQEGMSPNDIGKKLGRDGRLVRTHLKTAGIPIRSHQEAAKLALAAGNIRQTTLNEDFFQVLTPASSWILGLIFGDGHVQRVEGKTYSVVLAGTEQVLQDAAKHLGHDRKPKRVHQRGRELNVWKVVCCSKRLVESLSQYGLIGGNKSRTMRWPSSLPKELSSHFVRGLWDSDGGWRRRGSHLQANYTSASLGFIEDLKKVLEARGLEPRTYEHHPILNGKQFDSYKLWLRAADSRELAGWLYANTTPDIRCVRKYQLAVLGGIGP